MVLPYVVNSLDSFTYPAHDGNGHAVAERLVARAIGCWLAAMRNQGVALAGRQPNGVAVR